jgi:hypothetical protein
MPMKRPCRVGIVNYADVRNFGDVLFPLVVAKELCARLPDCEVTYFNATGSTWGGMTATRLDAGSFTDLDAMILGGGEVVHRRDEMLVDIYSRFGLSSMARPTELVFGWSHAPVPYKAWIGLGMPEPTLQVQADVAAAANGLNLVGARGMSTLERMQRCGADNAKLCLSPDLGWLFPRLLQDYRQRLFPSRGRPYATVQALRFSAPEPIVAVLDQLSDAAGLEIVLVPLTRCWGDVEPLRVLQAASGGRFILVEDDACDLEKLAVLGGATLHVGQSMHGFIASAAQNRAAGLITPLRDDKFDELLKSLALPQLRCPSWESLDALINTLLWTPLVTFTQIRRRCEQALDALFDKVCEAIVERE